VGSRAMQSPRHAAPAGCPVGVTCGVRVGFVCGNNTLLQVMASGVCGEGVQAVPSMTAGHPGAACLWAPAAKESLQLLLLRWLLPSVWHTDNTSCRCAPGLLISKALHADLQCAVGVVKLLGRRQVDATQPQQPHSLHTRQRMVLAGRAQHGCMCNKPNRPHRTWHNRTRAPYVVCVQAKRCMQTIATDGTRGMRPTG
jgi:hypothetical protein